MSLTDAAVRNASPKEKQFTLYDAEGLFLLVLPNGSKLWRWKYGVDGREKRLCLGVYPKVSLKAERSASDGHQT
ncbi:MAG: Arm DNA-binding domain-containing protein, partial [Humidesulfovibrio sp.]|nr:Arm DNA-binding domain-containing protein [Humidesulfovibrio sp.]